VAGLGASQDAPFPATPRAQHQSKPRAQRQSKSRAQRYSKPRAQCDSRPETAPDIEPQARAGGSHPRRGRKVAPEIHAIFVGWRYKRYP
jgi:hypothetical protein